MPINYEALYQSDVDHGIEGPTLADYMYNGKIAAPAAAPVTPTESLGFLESIGKALGRFDNVLSFKNRPAAVGRVLDTSGYPGWMTGLPNDAVKALGASLYKEENATPVIDNTVNTPDIVNNTDVLGGLAAADQAIIKDNVQAIRDAAWAKRNIPLHKEMAKLVKDDTWARRNIPLDKEMAKLTRGTKPPRRPRPRVQQPKLTAIPEMRDAAQRQMEQNNAAYLAARLAAKQRAEAEEQRLRNLWGNDYDVMFGNGLLA